MQIPGNCHEVPFRIADEPLTDNQGVSAETLRKYGLLLMLGPWVESRELSRRLCYELMWSTLGVNLFIVQRFAFIACLHEFADILGLDNLDRFVYLTKNQRTNQKPE